jgi:hypothetical protein
MESTCVPPPILDNEARRGRIVIATRRPLYPLERHGFTIVQEAGWKAGLIWKCPENFRQLGSDPRTVQSIARRFTAIRYFVRLYCRPTADLFLKIVAGRRGGGGVLNEMY